MAYTMFIYPNRKDGKSLGQGFDVSSLAHCISYSTSLQGYPGKLTFTLEKDPNNILELENGYAVAFSNKEKPVFWGYIFTIATDSQGQFKITAYDQMRYLQNHDYMLIESGNNTLNEVFEKICNNFGLKGEIKKGNIDIRLKDNAYIDVSGFEILQNSIDEVMLAKIDDEEAPYFFVRDRFGLLELNELSSNAQMSKIIDDNGNVKGNYVGNLVTIGHESLLIDWQYEISIDKETFNTIEIVENLSKDKTGGSQCKKFHDNVFDVNTQQKWGVLKKVITLQNSLSENDLKRMKQYHLDLYNNQTRTIKLDAIGQDGLYAGDSFYLDLEKKLGISQFMYIESATHNYDGDLHTMSLEVSLPRTKVGKL